MENEDGKVFDEDYVQKLRHEAAGYRTQLKDMKSELENYRSLEGQITQMRVENELIRRGIQAEPDWVKVPDGTDIAKAIDAFVEKYPHLAVKPGPAPEFVPNPLDVPDPIGKAKNSSPKNVDKIFGQRTMEEVKADPVARKAVERFYRQHLPNSPIEDD